MSDPVHQFEHTHATLSKLALEAGRALGDLARSVPDSTKRAALAGQLKQFESELLHHFAREEEGLFPFVGANIPMKADVVDRLIEGHDQICGTIVRLVHLVDGGADVTALAAHYARFEAAYAEHSRREAALFEELNDILDETHRHELAEILRGL